MNNQTSRNSAEQWHEGRSMVVLLRLFRLSLGSQLLLLALAGSWAHVAGWRLADQWWLSDTSRNVSASEPFGRFRKSVELWPGQGLTLPGPLEPILKLQPRQLHAEEYAIPTPKPQVSPWRRHPFYVLTQPYLLLTRIGQGGDRIVYLVTGAIWSLLVWGIFGGAISRIAVVRLGRDERIGIREAVAFACRKILSYVGAPLGPLAAITVMAIPLAIAGLILRADVGVAIVSVGWIVALLFGFVMAIFAIGLLFGWPLMWATISAEGSDAFDALSRSYQYTFQRPLYYLLYAAVASLLGIFGWFVVEIFAEATILLTQWGLSWGAGYIRLMELQLAIAGSGLPEAAANGAGNGSADEVSTPLWIGAALMRFFNDVARSFVLAYAYSFFWSAAAGIYLLLRRDADEIEIDDVYLQEIDEITYGLPPMTKDTAGVPGVVGESAIPPTTEQPTTKQPSAEQQPPPQTPPPAARVKPTPTQYEEGGSRPASGESSDGGVKE